jgi:hypothetical protein
MNRVPRARPSGLPGSGASEAFAASYGEWHGTG